MKSWIHKEGSAGQEVARVQKILSIKQDGKFGPQTKAALEEFQSNNGLVADGVLGPKTRQEMEIEIYGGIDISKWNKINHWDLLKNSGQAEFCWVKATEGNTYVCNQFLSISPSTPGKAPEPVHCQTRHSFQPPNLGPGMPCSSAFLLYRACHKG